MVNHSEKLISYIPPITRADLTVRYLQASGLHFDKLQDNLRDVYSQTLIDQATWALALYEKKYGITSSPADSLEEKRRRILTVKNTKRLSPYRFSEIMNRYMEGSTASIHREASEYRLYAHLPIDDILDFSEMVSTAQALAPATLEFLPVLKSQISPANHRSTTTRMKLRAFNNFFDIIQVYLNGHYKLDGTFDLRGIISNRFKTQFTVRAPIIKEKSYKTVLVNKKNYWELDGEYLLDGTRKLNAEKTEEAI